MEKNKKFALFIKKKFRTMFYIGLMSNVFTYVSELVDSILGGRFIGSEAVSAIGMIQPFYMVIIFVGGLISAGTDTLYSRAAGNFDQKKANAIFGQSLAVTLFLSVIMTAIMVTFKEPLINLYANGNSQYIMELARDYYDFYCLVAFFYPIQWLLFSIVFTDGGSKITVLGDISNMVVNLIVSYLCVNSMGIKGLGLGTFCGLLASILVMCIHFFTKSNSIGFGFQFKPKEILETIALGLSSSTSPLMCAIVDFVMNIFILNTIGYRYLPAYSIANMVLNLGLVLSHGGTASNPLNSIYYGEKNPDGNKKTMYITTKYALIEAVIITLLVEAASGVIPSLYSITDPEIFSASVWAVRVIGITLIPTSMVLIYMMYYSTVGHNGFSMLLLVNYLLIFPLILCYSLGKSFGIYGIFTALALTPIFSLIVCLVVMLLKYNKKKIPLLLLDTEADIRSWDVLVTKENNMELCDLVCTTLKDSFNTDDSKISKIRLALEETLMLILENNPEKKVYSECTIFVNKDNVELVIRDNGIINDLSQKDETPTSFRDYVYKSISGKMFGNSYIKTASYNRYKFDF